MTNPIIEEKKTKWNREEMEEKLKEQIRTMRKMVGVMGGWNQSEAMVFGAALPNLVSFMYEEISSAEQAGYRRAMGEARERFFEIFKNQINMSLQDFHEALYKFRFVIDPHHEDDK